MRRPASVVRRPSVRRKLFYIFDFSSETAGGILTKVGVHEVLNVPFQTYVRNSDPSTGGATRGKSRSQGVPSFKNLLLRNRLMDLKTKCIQAIYKDGLLKVMFGMKIRAVENDAFLTSFWTLSNPCKIAYFFHYFS